MDREDLSKYQCLLASQRLAAVSSRLGAIFLCVDIGFETML